MKSKKKSSFFANVISVMVLFAANLSANTTCIWFFHQPKEPKGIKRLRKF